MICGRGAVCGLILAASTGVMAANTYRDFLDTQGRIIRGRVLRYNDYKREVTIERDDRRVATVPISVFDQADQDYILEWVKVQDFMDESSFRIDTSRKEKDDDDESYESLNMEQDVEKHYYEITLENRSDIKLDNMSLQYCIFYEQDEVERHKQATNEGVLCGTLEIPSMAPKSERILYTDSVTIYKRVLDADWIYTSDIKNVQKGQVEGVWIRIMKETESGKTYTRDYCSPDSLPNSYAWTKDSMYAGMNKAPRKKKK